MRVKWVYDLIIGRGDQYFHEPDGRVKILIFETKYQPTYTSTQHAGMTNL